jgi:rRNA maturation RNase YbeY
MITFSVLEIRYNLKKKLDVRNWIKSIAHSEYKDAGDIAFIFCNDEYLGKMNEQYLKHHTLTDIITFDYSEAGKVSGDIFISIDRVKENALSFGNSFDQELGRVMAHGVLHLCGYNDKTAEEKKVMRSREDFCLASYPNI